MYLKKIVCENMGPISNIDIEPSFTAEGNPKPLVLVGKNGTGKSILISNIIDSFFELGDQAYSDLTEKINMGHSYFKITGHDQIQIGKQNMISYLQFCAGENDEGKVEYIYHVGNIDINLFKSKLAEQFKPTIYQQEQEKNITQNNKLIEKEFTDNTIAYFPPERSAIPYWMGKSYSSQNSYGSITLSARFKGSLNKPIIAADSTAENTKWLIDVIVDSKATLEKVSANTSGAEWQVKNFDDRLLDCRKNIDNVLSVILGDQVFLELGNRNAAKMRLLICSTSKNARIVPTIDSLSTGQMILLNMFFTIIRYSDVSNIVKSSSLDKIKGIVVIDEIELHLHSDLQRNILPSLIKLFPKVQFIITTHSPLFLLGMQELLGSDGFDIYQMPDGQRIGVEDFSEFQNAYTYMAQTQKYRNEIQKVVAAKSIASEKALIITEGATDWKHMKRAWKALSTFPEYFELTEKFEFLEYEPKNSPSPAEIKLEMGDSALVELCENIAKIKQPRKMIFVADADRPDATKSLRSGSKKYKKWGNNVYSFEIPVPSHRSSTPRICIEHYYTDEEIKTEKKIEGIKRRLFFGNEFDNRGISNDFQYSCVAKNKCGQDKIAIIEGDSESKVTLITDKEKNVALPKMQFANAILANETGFNGIKSDNFKLIFDIIKAIVVPEQATLAQEPQRTQIIHANPETAPILAPPQGSARNISFPSNTP